MKAHLLLLISFHLFLGILLAPALPGDDSTTSKGKASYYHDKFHGRVTSNGEQYDRNDFTAAHRTLPFNSIVHVVNKNNGKSVIVRINDRGPFLRSRIIDLSRSAAQKIDMVPYGIVPVSIRVMTLFDHLPLNDSLFSEGDIWSCYGKKIKLSGHSALVWISESWKHAFYTASKLALDNHLEGVGVKITGPVDHRTYDIIVTSINSENECDSIVAVLKKEGYFRAHSLKK